MKLSILLISLLPAASLANILRARQSNDDLAARVKAIEDFLAQPDSSCVAQCRNNSCSPDCRRDIDPQDDIALGVSNTYM